jgi:cytochrome P450
MRYVGAVRRVTPPSDPVAAVTHPDPYPYYAGLVAHRPLYRDESLGLWVASSAAAVTGVLTNDRCRVRPTAEPIPVALVGSTAGEIFRHLVRMNDGAAHGPMKRAVSRTLESLDIGQVATVGRERARALVEDMAPHADSTHLTDFAFRLTAEVVATLLGATADALPSVARWTDDFVRCLAPGVGAEQLQRGATAAGHLLESGRSWKTGHGLGAALHHHAHGDGDAIVANAIGFLSQSYDATAGLIGNTLLALARHPDLRRAVPAVVLEVLRHDPPVHNTRRFVANDGDVAGVQMKAGDAVLVVLAAANHDPAVNPDPADFDVTRAAPTVFTFGIGPHACPGAMLATTIAAAGVHQLVASGVPFDELAATVRYRPSLNTRIPLFGRPG